MCFKEFYLLLFFFGILLPLVRSPILSEADHNIGVIPPDAPCYKAIGHDSIYLAMKFSSRIPIPPPIIGIHSRVSLRVNMKYDSSKDVRLFFVLTNGSCKTSLSVSNAKKNFSEISIFSVVTLGVVRSRQRFSTFNVDLYPNVRNGFRPYSDDLGLSQIYVSYVPNQSEIIPTLPFGKSSTISSYLQLNDFQTEFICISYKDEVFVIKPNFGDRPRNIPIYQGLNVRIYSNNQPVVVRRVSAWPCGNDRNLYEKHKPILVLDDIQNASVYANFEELGPAKESEPILISMDELGKGPYFSIDDKRELLSSRDDWLNAENRLFLANAELHELTLRDYLGFCYRYRTVNGHKTYLLFRSKFITDTSDGFTYLKHQRVGRGTDCDSYTFEYLQKVD